MSSASSLFPNLSAPVARTDATASSRLSVSGASVGAAWYAGWKPKRVDCGRLCVDFWPNSWKQQCIAECEIRYNR